MLYECGQHALRPLAEMLTCSKSPACRDRLDGMRCSSSCTWQVRNAVCPRHAERCSPRAGTTAVEHARGDDLDAAARTCEHLQSCGVVAKQLVASTQQEAATCCYDARHWTSRQDMLKRNLCMLKKTEYQLMYIAGGLAEGGELEELKKMHAVQKFC